MKQRWITFTLAGAIALTAIGGLAACAPEGGGGGGGVDADTIQIWGPGHETSFIESRLDAYVQAWETEHPGEKYPYKLVQANVGEDDAENKFNVDAKACGDVYHFASNQLMSLMNAGGLARISPTMEERIKAEDMEEIVEACKIGDSYYAYPYTSDNGYCLFYDSDVVTITEETTVMDVIEQCKAAKKQFIMPLTDAYYAASFIYGAGADYRATYNNSGKFLSSTNTFADKPAGSEYSYGELGGKMLADLLELSNSSTKGYTSTVIEGGNTEVETALNTEKFGAAVTGSWEAASIAYATVNGEPLKAAACALPDWVSTLDGNTYPWRAFMGYKMIGVNPHSSHLAEAHRIAAFLTSEESQLAHFNEWYVGPSNKKVAESDEVLNSEYSFSFKAMNEQREKCSRPQAPCPQGYWNNVGSFAEWLEDYNANISDPKTPAADKKDLKTRVEQLAKALTQN